MAKKEESDKALEEKMDEIIRQKSDENSALKNLLEKLAGLQLEQKKNNGRNSRNENKINK